MTNPEFFADVARRAEELRLEVRKQPITLDVSNTVEMLCYHLREAHNKALVIAGRTEPQVAKAGGD